MIRLFAPRAKKVSIEVSETLSMQSPQRLEMDLTCDQVTWEIMLKGNFHGWFYHLFVDGPDDGKTTKFDYGRPLLDPWARGTVGPEGPAIILDESKFPSPTTGHTPPDWKDLSVLECHIRDLVHLAPLDLSQTERAGFSGVTKLLKEQSSYIHQLGINTLEFQPLQQFDSDRRGISLGAAGQ